MSALRSNAPPYTPTTLGPSRLNPASRAYEPRQKFSFRSAVNSASRKLDGYKLRHGRCMVSERATELRKLLLNKSKRKGAGFKWNDRRPLGSKQLANIRAFLNDTFDGSLTDAQRETLVVARSKIKQTGPLANSIESFHANHCQDIVEAIVCRWLRPSELKKMFADESEKTIYKGTQTFTLPDATGRKILGAVIGKQGAFFKQLTEKYNALYIYAKYGPIHHRINVYAFSKRECEHIISKIRSVIHHTPGFADIEMPEIKALTLKDGLVQVSRVSDARASASRRSLPPIPESPTASRTPALPSARKSGSAKTVSEGTGASIKPRRSSARKVVPPK